MFKKMLILICAFTLLAPNCLSNTVTQYDKYGRATGSYRKTSSGYTEYDKYGRVNGYYKQDGKNMVKYDKYGKINYSYKLK